MTEAERRLWESSDGLRLLDMWLSDLPKEEIQRRNETEFKPLLDQMRQLNAANRMNNLVTNNLDRPDKADCSNEIYSERTYRSEDGSLMRERSRSDGATSTVKIGHPAGVLATLTPASDYWMGPKAKKPQP